MDLMVSQLSFPYNLRFLYFDNFNCKVLKCKDVQGLLVLKLVLTFLTENCKRDNVADHFERTGRVLGEGAFSRVEVCRDRKTNKEYAVKVCKL